MTVLTTDFMHVKSKVVTNTPTNGGPMGTTAVQSGGKNNIFPRVTQDERISGIPGRWRKTFFHNRNLSGDSAYGFLFYLETPSSSGDRIFIGLGTGADTQSLWSISDEYPHWTGTGRLDANIIAGVASVSLQMESNDFEFIPGGTLFITDRFMESQTLATSPPASVPIIGDSVEHVGGIWVKRTFTTNTTYPFGWYYGGNVVFTNNSSNIEYPKIFEDKTEDESIGTGDGSPTPSVSNFGNVTNGLNFKGTYVDGRASGWLPMKPRLDITVSATPTTLWFDFDGNLVGATAGKINMATGAWITPPTFIGSPDSGTPITATYWDKPYSWVGNVVTVQLADTIAENYTALNTYAGGCVEMNEIVPIQRSWVETSVSGTFDETTYPPVVNNVGTVYDTWTLTFTSGTVFTCSGLISGNVGTGSTSANFSPSNPVFGQPFFTIPLLGWGGTWTAGDIVVFVTEPSSIPILWKEVIPAATPAVTTSIAPYGAYWE